MHKGRTHCPASSHPDRPASQCGETTSKEKMTAPAIYTSLPVISQQQAVEAPMEAGGEDLNGMSKCRDVRRTPTHPIGSEKTRIVAHSEPDYRGRTIRLIEPRSFFGVKTTRLIARAEKLGLKRHA